jgi:hypothetical protein
MLVDQQPQGLVLRCRQQRQGSRWLTLHDVGWPLSAFSDGGGACCHWY